MLKQEEKGVRAAILMGLEMQGVFKNLELSKVEVNQLMHEPEAHWPKGLVKKLAPFLDRLKPEE